MVNYGFASMQLNLTAGEEVEIEYEVDGWFYVSVQKIGIYSWLLIDDTS